MSIESTLLRFFFIYSLLTVAVTFILDFLGAPKNSVMGIIVIMAAIYWISYSFARANDRFFTADEKRRVLIGMVLIYTAIQFTLGIAYVAFQEEFDSSGLKIMLAVTAFFTLIIIAISSKFLSKMEDILINSNVIYVGSTEGELDPLPESSVAVKVVGRSILVVGVVLMLLIIPASVIKMMAA